MATSARSPTTRRPRRTTARWFRVVLTAAAASGLAGHAAYSSADQAAWLQAGQRFKVTAVLVQAAGAPSYRAVAMWSAPIGSEAAGMIPLPREVPAGGRQPIWVDYYGRLTTPPLTRAQVLAHAVRVAFMVFVGVLILLLVARRIAGVRRARRWASVLDIEWRLVGPTWRRHYLP